MVNITYYFITNSDAPRLPGIFHVSLVPIFVTYIVFFCYRNMKPLFSIVVTILVLAANAHPENIEEVKELPQNKEPIVEAEESKSAARIERCTTCTGSKLNIKPHKDALAALTQLPPGAEVHTQQSFEGCSSEKGCAGIKVKDGQILERFGNLDSFRQAAALDTGNEFTFHPAGSLGNNLLEGGLNGEGGPFWWMNQNSPFKNAGAGGNFEKFSKSSSSSYSTTGNGASGGGANFDLAGNPFLNGEFSKVGGGFNSGGASFTGAGASGAETKPSSYQSSSFESSSFSTSNKDLDLSQNPFLAGGKGQAGFNGAGFQAQGSFGANQFGAGNTASQFGSGQSNSASQFGAGQSNSASRFGQTNTASQFGSGQGQFGQGQTGFGQQGQNFNGQAFGSSSTNKFSASGSGYTGSSPSPFSASTAGSNINQIQNTQKASEFDFAQQQQTQQNIDEAFQHTGNVNAHEHSGGDLQQTCAGQGYVCVHKAQCNNGVVNTNGGNLLQANTQVSSCLVMLRCVLYLDAVVCPALE